jgi:hypothetical protein
MMEIHECPPVTESKRINAPASDIFAILSDPKQHTAIDGSGMLRGALTDSVITGVGDVFVLRMYFSEMGDYEMANTVITFEPDRRISWEPRRHDVEQEDWEHSWGYELTPDGNGATVVTEIFNCARWPKDEREKMENGKIWVDAMRKTLAKLDEVCSQAR